MKTINLFQSVRNEWLDGLTPSDCIYIERVLGPGWKQCLVPTKIVHGDYQWDDINFHLKHRLTTYKEIVSLMKVVDPQIEKVIKKEYKLSILPLNLVTGNKDLWSKFIPKKDFFTDHYAKSWDPYGIFKKGARIYKGKTYLGSQKFERSFLMNITGDCPMGCTPCYKGRFTRITNKKFYTNLQKAVSQQSQLVVDYSNNHTDIKTVIISGGEPLLLSNDGMAEILSNFERARYLGELRICTGTIFQGLPFRIDNELLNILADFENKTGIKIHFNAHLSHPAQFTPEALVAVRQIIRKGFAINTQVPLQRGVNVFPDNMEKTLAVLSRLAELQGVSGVRPYKYILHMNVGSLEYSVPLEFMLKVLAELKYRVDHPLPETWQPVSVSILCKAGNILLSPQLLLLIKKKIVREKNSVIYQIPVPTADSWQWVEYVEPLLKGLNDNPIITL